MLGKVLETLVNSDQRDESMQDGMAEVRYANTMSVNHAGCLPM